MPKVTMELLERDESGSQQLLGKQLPAFLWASETQPVLQWKNLLMFYLMPLVLSDATDIQSTSPKAHEESCYALMGYLHFFLTFPSASAYGINGLILSATLLRQRKAKKRAYTTLN